MTANREPAHRVQVAVLILWLATVVGAAAMIAVAMVSSDAIAIVVLALDAVTFASMGALIVRRRPGNRVGWLLATTGPALVLTFSGFIIGGVRFVQAGSTDPAAMVFGWVGAIAFYPTFMLFGLTGLLFPDGNLPSPRWRPAVWALIVAVTASAVVLAVAPGPVAEELADNPFAIDHPAVTGLASVASVIAILSILLTIGLAAVAVAVRFRRSSDETREQLKWFVAAVAVFAILLPLSFIDVEFMEQVGFTPIDLLAISSLALIPIAVGVAVLRYRLYAIDRIISRTLAWALLTALLIASFVLLVISLQGLLAPVTRTNSIAVAASTLIVAAAFQPLRRWVQSEVDRHFDRARYDTTRIVEGFSGRLRDQLDLDTLCDEVRQVATVTVRPRDATVWLRTVEREHRPE